MGFFSNLLHLVFIAIAIAICICYIIILCLPWYVLTIDYTAPFPGTGSCTSTRLWYWFDTTTGCLPKSCADQTCVLGEQFPGTRTPEWCNQNTCTNQNAVYITSFVLVLLGFLLMVIATVMYALPMWGRKGIAYILSFVSFAFLLIALLIFFALAPASVADAQGSNSTCPSDGGPCASFAGQKIYRGLTPPVTETWGPAGGWIFGIIVAAAILVWAIITCCCCSAVAESDKKEDKA